MHAHFTSHVYHRHSHESYSFGVTETGAQAFTCRHGRHVSGRGMVMAFNPRPSLSSVSRIRELLHDGAADLTAEDLAAAAGCSRYAAYRAFTQAYGLAPSDYQRQLRVRAARRLLIAGVSPARAAAEAGFADQAHLTRWFRRYYGVTPGAYRSAAGQRTGIHPNQ